MNRYRSEQVEKEGCAVIVLSDDGSDSRAEIVPEIGNNLYRFVSRGREVIMPPSSLTALRHEEFADFKYGTPILSPPNRVKNGSFMYRGEKFTLPINEPPDHHLHGEICSKGWEVVEFGASEEQGAYVVSRFRYDAHPEIMSYFPRELTFTVTMRLEDGRLSMSGTIANEGEQEAPFAFGLHPYFQVPFAGEGDIVLKVPAEMEWPVTSQAFVTGRPETTPFCGQLREGVSIVDYPRLGCSLLSLPEGEKECRIELPEEGYGIVYRFDELFSYVVLFRPDWAEAFSLEPYTCVTDAFNVPYEHELTGVRGIRPGETMSFTTSIEAVTV